MSLNLTVCRDLYVPRELVFEVWTQPDHLVGWFPPQAATAPSFNADTRPEGRFDFRWRTPGGGAEGESGEYLAMQRPQGFRCRIESSSPKTPASARIREVKLGDLGGACRIEIVEEGIETDEQQAARRQWWLAALDRLETYFSAI